MRFIKDILTIAGTLIGITNTLGTLMGVISPAVATAITNRNVSIVCFRPNVAYSGKTGGF